MQEVFYILRRLIDSIFNDVNVWFSKIKRRSINHSRIELEMAFYNVERSITVSVSCYDRREGRNQDFLNGTRGSPMRNFQELRT